MVEQILTFIKESEKPVNLHEIARATNIPEMEVFDILNITLYGVLKRLILLLDINRDCSIYYYL